MAYEPLHHKYRPQTFADLVGQEAIATTLSNALTSERIAPAYLFSGPRGTGKTSSARILAKSLNCLSADCPTPHPCGQCEVCQAIARGTALDVIEIDAASNTGVDNIREIIERAQFSPVQCRYKVYVIDECHMLSQAAFNALLKTLEEPPAHVIFVLATTDPQRVLPTIISRCQRFDYRRIPLGAMAAHLSKIAQKEEIDITEAAITLVGQLANGGLRDAESLLDQLSLLSATVTPDRVWDLVGAVPERELLELLRAIRGGLAQAIIEQCRRSLDRGREPLIVLQNLAGAYLNLLLAKTAPDRSDLAAVTAPTWAELCQEAQAWNINDILQGQQHLRESEVQIKNTTQPRLWLEVTLMGLLNLEVRSQESEVKSEIRSQSSIQNPAAIAGRQSKSKSQSPEDIKQDSDVTSEAYQDKTDLSETPPPPQLPVTANTQLSQIWEAALAQLSLLTQALIRSHCHLLSLDENVAHIGIKTEPLLKHAQTKVEELETAFQAVLNRPIKARIQVASPTDSLLETKTGDNRETVGKSEVNFPSRNAGQEEIKSQQSEISNERQEEVKYRQSKISSEGQEERPDLRKETSPPPSSNPLPSITSINFVPGISEEYSALEVKEAAESLAKSFEGQVVDLNPQMNGKSTAETVEDSASSTVTVTNLLGEGESDLSLQSPTISPQSNSKPIIQGRPDLSEIDEEDDIPF
jgi:DNA polymerase-3 subunit gamma/tau